MADFSVLTLIPSDARLDPAICVASLADYYQGWTPMLGFPDIDVVFYILHQWQPVQFLQLINLMSSNVIRNVMSLMHNNTLFKFEHVKEVSLASSTPAAVHTTIITLAAKLGRTLDKRVIINGVEYVGFGHDDGYAKALFTFLMLGSDRYSFQFLRDELASVCPILYRLMCDVRFDDLMSGMLEHDKTAKFIEEFDRFKIVLKPYFVHENVLDMVVLLVMDPALYDIDVQDTEVTVMTDIIVHLDNLSVVHSGFSGQTRIWDTYLNDDYALKGVELGDLVIADHCPVGEQLGAYDILDHCSKVEWQTQVFFDELLVENPLYYDRLALCAHAAERPMEIDYIGADLPYLTGGAIHLDITSASIVTEILPHFPGLILHRAESRDTPPFIGDHSVNLLDMNTFCKPLVTPTFNGNDTVLIIDRLAKSSRVVGNFSSIPRFFSCKEQDKVFHADVRFLTVLLTGRKDTNIDTNYPKLIYWHVQKPFVGNFSLYEKLLVYLQEFYRITYIPSSTAFDSSFFF